MHQSVKDTFFKFSCAFEGLVPWMYLDVLGKVTVGVGNLIDSPDVAEKLPFVYRSNGQPASRAVIRREWQAIKRNPALAKGGHLVAKRVATLMLLERDITALVDAKACDFEGVLRKHYPEWDSFPADAQLGVMSMAWAMGPYFPPKFPQFSLSVRSRRWTDAAKHCLMRTAGNPGLVPRNHANVELFVMAQQVQLAGWPIDILRGWS